MDNRSSAPGFARSEDTQFEQLLEMLEKIQKSGALGTRIEKKDNQYTTVIAFRRKVDKEIEHEISKARRLLDLKNGTMELKVTYGAAPTQEGEIAILSRSLMDIIIELSAQIDVPAEQVAEGRTYATSRDIGEETGKMPLFIRVHCGKEKPSDSFAAINNRSHWFWIDDRDRQSKVTFTFLMILFSLLETGAPPQAPAITVPIS